MIFSLLAMFRVTDTNLPKGSLKDDDTAAVHFPTTMMRVPPGLYELSSVSIVDTADCAAIAFALPKC